MVSSSEAIENSERLLREMANSGQKIVGYLYPHLPIEMIMAHGLVPVLLWTDPTVQGAFENSLQTFACGYARNVFSQRVREVLPPIDGLIFPGNTCDSLQNVGDVWRFRYPDDKIFRLTYPVGDLGDASVSFFTEELRRLDKTLAEQYGTSLSRNSLNNAIGLVNEFREVTQYLYSARLIQPSVLSYFELVSLVRQFLTTPSQEIVDNITDLMSTVRNHLEENIENEIMKLRDSIVSKNLEGVEISRDSKAPRIAVAGGMLEPVIFAQLMEGVSGASPGTVVFDFLSFGYKTVFTPPTELGEDVFESLARATIDAPKEPTHEGLIKRLGFFKKALISFNIDGLIICEQFFCDPDEFEAPSLTKIAAEVGVPKIRLHLDPELSDRARLEGKVQSFLESLTG